jgi:uncharacterized protein (DUF1330 family)
MAGEGKISITVLLFVREGEEKAFDEYESAVLPLLASHHGKLLYRLRPNRKNYLNESAEYPYEIHLLEFESRQDYENYFDDPEREKHTQLREKSVLKAIVIEGETR